jgi:hypothetical protein
MIKLKNILNEQGGSFRDLGDGYVVMKEPEDVPVPGQSRYGNFNPDVKGFTFSSDDKVATKQYKGSKLKLVWLSTTGLGKNQTVKFNVFYYNKDQGVFTFGSFERWLTKLAQNITQMLPVAELTSLGFKKAKDPKSGYNSYVKIIKISYAETATAEYPNGLWSCDTEIRVFYQTANKWMIRVKIDYLDDDGLKPLIAKRKATYSTDYGGFRVGHNVKKKNWLTGSEYKEFEQRTPKDVESDWLKNTGQATFRVQKVPVTADKLINTLKYMETNIRKYKGLVGPYNDPKFQNNYLLLLAKKNMKK